jgi:hypothetical protein
VVLACYSQAAGGEALNRLMSETRRGSVVRATGGRVPLEVVSMAPNRWHWSQTLAWGDQLAFGFDGHQGWVRDGGGVFAMTPSQTLDFRLLFDLTAPLNLQDFFAEITLKGSEEIAGRVSSVLLGRSPEGLETELSFDRETGLLSRVGDMVLDDYREVDDITRPFRLRMGDMLVVEFAEIRHDLPVDESLFHRPETALPTLDPVIYRRHEEVQVPEEALDACVGEYQLPEGPVLSVTREGKHLMLQTPGSMKFEIFPVSERIYVMRFNHLELHFLVDSSGRVDRLSLGTAGSRVASRIR